jgi:hypothetical protein
MKQQYTSALQRQPRHILEEAGYHQFRDPNTGKFSFVMRLGQRFYPRYHVYVKQLKNGGIEVDLHIDQKQASYEGQRAHSGEYSGERVEEEMARIDRWFTHYSQ